MRIEGSRLLLRLLIMGMGIILGLRMGLLDPLCCPRQTTTLIGLMNRKKATMMIFLNWSIILIISVMLRNVVGNGRWAGRRSFKLSKTWIAKPTQQWSSSPPHPTAQNSTPSAPVPSDANQPSQTQAACQTYAQDSNASRPNAVPHAQ